MVIAKIETFPLRIPFRPGYQSDAGAWGDKTLAGVDSLIVKVTTDQGVVGWGETFGFRAVRSAQLAIDEMIAPLCIGQDAAQIAPLMLDIQKKLHIFGRSGPLMYGISAIDIALWDIAGKVANVPVHSLLGGSRTSHLRCYASLIRYTDPALVRTNVRRAIDAGFRSLKLHEIDMPSIRAAREEAGPGIEITLDVNCPWTLNEALVMAENLQAFDLRWLEEPLWPPEN
jgi:L-alanine-DL-glutamate epimerase-like enolase superfamily enzyme